MFIHQYIEALFMKTKLILLVSAIMLGSPALANQTITHQADLTYQSAPSEHFSGQAQFVRLPNIATSLDGHAIVQFDKGAVTDWHSHSQGQYLIVTEGEGLTQEWGKPIQTIKKGDMIWCPPNVKHWHGATAHSKMSHIVISPNASNNKVTWLEAVDKNTLPNAKANADRFKQNTPLTAKQLAIVPIASLSAVGELDKLSVAIEHGLSAGLSVDEIQEVFIHQYAYAGFPRALNGINTLQTVIKNLQNQGIIDKQGQSQVAFVDGEQAYQTGVENLTLLTGRTPPDVLAGVAGADYALKAHLFGYLFSRENLSPVNRQLVTLSTLMALGNVNAQLSSHLKNTQNLGVSKQDLYRVIDGVQRILGDEKADNARRVLEGK